MDSAFIRRHMSKQPLPGAPGDAPAAVCEHMLIWHRGISVHTKSGRMVMEKIEAAADKLFERFASWVYSTAFWRALPLVQQAAPAAGEELVWDLGNNSFVQRVSFRDFKFSWSYLFDTKTTIVEPAFRDVVAVYRLKGESPTVHIKTYSEVPVADWELVFPEKTVLYKYAACVCARGFLLRSMSCVSFR